MKKLLVEKYRPSDIGGYVFNNDDTKRKVNKWIKEQEIPNVLLSGSAGTGKSTLARILVNELDIQDNDVFRVNASLENGIGFIRESLEPWCKRSGFSSFKVVVLEECLHEDELVRIGTPDNWKAVRMGDLIHDKDYDIVSINMDSGNLESDVGRVISDKTDDVYEIELEDGRRVMVTEDHPMLVMVDGKIIEKTIRDGLNAEDYIVTI